MSSHIFENIIIKTFWQSYTLPVIVLIVLIIAVLVLYKFQLRETEQKLKSDNEALKEADLKQRIIQSEITALRAQMNPHFIFNCLNSIQLFTAQNETEKATLYLGKFSKLIRIVLENSKSEKITLASELETLRLYIEMESMRFKGKINYIIYIADDIEPSHILIPSLLVQPYVENAIWHGLMHKEEGGDIKINIIKINTNTLQIEIVDNGIGRKKALEYKSKSVTENKSYGMKLSSERIELLNQLNACTSKVQIFDLKNEKNIGSGTKVVIELPI